MIRNVILDWSGTIVDDLDAVLIGTNAVLTHFGHREISKLEFRKNFVLPFSGFYERFLPGIPIAEIDQVYHASFLNRRCQVYLLPGVLEFLRFCRSTGRPLFILSTMSGAHFESEADRLGVRGFFRRVYVNATNKMTKIGTILDENQLKADETLFAGDMVHDIETARYGGVLSVAVLTGFDSPEKLAGASPDLVVRDLSYLHRILDSGGGQGLGETVQEMTSTDIHSDLIVSDARETEWIEIVDQEILCFIGVPPEERKTSQKLLVTVRFQIGNRFCDLDDQFEQTIDYAAVAAAVEQIAGESEIQLVETLVSRIADRLIATFPMSAIEVTVKKFILPNTKNVEVRTKRNARLRRP